MSFEQQQTMWHLKLQMPTFNSQLFLMLKNQRIRKSILSDAHIQLLFHTPTVPCYLVSVIDIGVRQRPWHQLEQHYSIAVHIRLECIGVAVLHSDHLRSLKQNKNKVQCLITHQNLQDAIILNVTDDRRKSGSNRVVILCHTMVSCKSNNHATTL